MNHISGISSTVPTLLPRKEHQAANETQARSDDHAPKNKGGSFIGAINKALKTTVIGNSLTVASTQPSRPNVLTESDQLAIETDEARLALASFMQQLMGALQSENAINSVYEMPSSNEGMGFQRPQLQHVIGFGGNDISDKLQVLIARLNREGNESSGLASSFNRLVNVLGGDDAEQTKDLKSFLKDLAVRSEGQRNSGNFLDTEV